MELFYGNTFLEIYDGIVKRIQQGNETSSAEAILTFALISKFKYDGHFPMDETFAGIYNNGLKKLALAKNTILQTNDRSRVPKDTHVIRTGTPFCPSHFTTKKEIADFLDFVCYTMDENTAWWLNDLWGQMGQWIKGSEYQQAIPHRIFHKLVNHFSDGHFDKEVDHLMGPGWSTNQRRNFLGKRKERNNSIQS